MEWSDKLYKADISFNSVADQEIIAAPGAGKRIVIDFIALIPTSATTLQLKDGATNYGGAFPLGATQSFTVENAIKNYDGIITLSPNSAFVVNTSVASQTSGFVRYRVIDNS